MAMGVAGPAIFLLCASIVAGAFAAERPDAGSPAGQPAGDLPVASDVRLGGNEAQTRMVVDFSQKVDVRAFVLASPYRVVVDLPQVAFQFRPKTGEGGRGLIKALRFGLVMPGGSRMVLDLVRPARVDKALVLDAANEQPARLVLDLVAINRDAFMRLVALEEAGPRIREQSHCRRTRAAMLAPSS